MKTSQELGQERFKSDKRQLGGLLMLIATTALVFPMAKLASLTGRDGTTATEGVPLSGLIASVFVIIMGVMGIPIGYLQAVHDWGNKNLTGFLLLLTQLAWMPFITDLTGVGKAARTGDAFFPPTIEASEGDVKFVGAMGMMGILGYGTGFLGSFAFIQFSLYAFQAGKPGDRPGSYYKGRLTFYSFCLFLVGLSQLMLGAYLLKNFGNGPLAGPVSVAMYMVHFPEISIFVGLVQVLNAFFGMARSFGLSTGADDHTFQATMLFNWVCTVSLQIMTQVAYAPGPTAAGNAPSQTMLTMGLYVICAYLDYKMRTTPETIPADYYGLEESEDQQSSTSYQEKEEVASAEKEEVDIEG
jgi:hypothetical protein